MQQASKIASFFLFPVIVLLVHLIAVKGMDLYKTVPNVDVPFHYVGGLSIAYTSTQILLYLEAEKITGTLNKAIFLVLILSLTATTTVFWEFAEFMMDRFLGTHLQPSIANTMQDQFLGILGGCTWAFIYFKKHLRKSRASSILSSRPH